MSDEEEKKAKYERCKAIREAHQSFVTKLTQETTTILTSELLSTEQLTRLDVTYHQLEVKSSSLSELDKEALSLCDVKDIAGEVEDSEAVVAQIIEGRSSEASSITRHIFYPTGSSSSSHGCPGLSSEVSSPHVQRGCHEMDIILVLVQVCHTRQHTVDTD